MHIPDGFIAPVVYLPASGAASLLWLSRLRRLRTEVRTAALPLLAALGAALFVLMLLSLPLPGGTSVHATGVAVLALRFRWGTVYLVTALALFIQTVLLGVGGITTLGINALALGLLGGGTARLCLRLPLPRSARVFAAGLLSVLAAAILIALCLGLQPLVASDAAGRPLYFPFPLAVAFPALVLPHLAVGVAEGLLTVGVDRLMRSRHAP